MTASIRAYMDNNASAPLRPQAREAMIDALARTGNASSVHGEGRDMRRLVEAARDSVAALVGANPSAVTFVASATEAANLALTPNVSLNGALRPAQVLFVLETEHPCILAGGRFSTDCIRFIPVHSNGLINMESFDAMLAGLGDDVPFVAVQLVNSETGIIQPVAEIAQKVQLKGGYMLCDAVQAAGRMPIDANALGVDFLILSAHKLGGPQGAGALVRMREAMDIPAAIRGGGQEKNRRAGTENVAALAGFGAAAHEASEEAEDYSPTRELRGQLEDGLASICDRYGLAERIVVFGTDVERVGNTTLFAVSGMKAETMLIAFDLEGVAVSSGSACSSGRVGHSHVLKAMGVAPDIAQGAIRVSLGWNSTQEDVAKFLQAFERIVKRTKDTLKHPAADAALASNGA